MKKTYERPTVELINFDENEFIAASGEHFNHGNHYGWEDPQPGYGNDGEHGHNHGGNGHGNH